MVTRLVGVAALAGLVTVLVQVREASRPTTKSYARSFARVIDETATVEAGAILFRSIEQRCDRLWRQLDDSRRDDAPAGERVGCLVGTTTAWERC